MIDLARKSAALVLVGLLAGCAHEGPRVPQAVDSGGLILGSVSYRERIALPGDAVVSVSLNDVTAGEGAAILIAETKVVAGGKQVPLPFELAYPRVRIAQGHYYALKAAIHDGGGHALFVEDHPLPIDFPVPPSAVTIWLKPAQAAAKETPSPLVGTAWLLEDLAGAGVVANALATLEFLADGKIAGRGSCNRFFGMVTVSGAELKFGPIGATKMACTDPAIGDQEAKYFAALEGAERYEMQGSMPLVHAKGLDKPLRFVRAPASKD